MERKLVVEVVEARDLLPKDGTGTSSPYVVVDFDGQRRRTRTVNRDLNPNWNETLLFDLVRGSVPDLHVGEQIEVDVLHDRRVGPSRRSNFLGRVRLHSRPIVSKGEEALIHFPLEKKSLFSWVRGEIGLKIYYMDVPLLEPVPADPPLPPADESNQAAKRDEETAPPPQDEPAVSSAQQAPVPLDTASGTEAPNPQQELKESEPTTPDACDSQQQDKPEDTSVVEAQPPPPLSPPALPAATQKEATPSWVNQPESRTIDRRPESVKPSTYDLVDKMQYLFVRVVRARSLPSYAWPHVRISAAGRNVTTATARRAAFFFEWDQTFAFARDPSAIDSSNLEISVWDLPPDANVSAADADKDFLGGLCFDVSEVPCRNSPDSPLAPQWYRLEGGVARGGDLMVATWIGTQADESFRNAWKADAPARLASSGSQIYQSPKLWYLRTTVIEAQDSLSTPLPAIFVRATLGFQMLKTRPAVPRNTALAWNEDLIFVVAEPFEEDQKLALSLEIRQGKDVILLGSAWIPLSSIERRVDDRKVTSRWLDLAPASAEETKKLGKKASSNSQYPCGRRLHVRLCLDGGYQVAEELPQFCSDFRPSARQLWRPAIGAVDVGIVGCRGLLPMKTMEGTGTTDAYAVAKYGPKWARTRTVADNFDPVWNEQFSWEVYDPCTVITIAVFDESDGGKDSALGRIRIRISTLETNRSYRGVYPLLMMLPTGVKRTGEIEISARFSRSVSTTAIDLLQIYTQPMLPAMHHIRPIPAAYRETLRVAAARTVAAHLSRSEQGLRREVVMWMLEVPASAGFSMRRVRSNWQRIVTAVSWAVAVARWTEEIRAWRNQTATVMAHGAMVVVAWHPELLAPAVALHLVGMGIWRYRRRPRGPAAHPCLKASGADGAVEREELEEELDGGARGNERARAVGVRLQFLLGDVAAQAERVQALLSWRDPRATGIFVFWCFLVAVVLLAVPMKAVAVALGFYYLRHPMFRDRQPPTVINFFKRLPSLSDRIM